MGIDIDAPGRTKRIKNATNRAKSAIDSERAKPKMAPGVESNIFVAIVPYVPNGHAQGCTKPSNPTLFVESVADVEFDVDGSLLGLTQVVAAYPSMPRLFCFNPLVRIPS